MYDFQQNNDEDYSMESGEEGMSEGQHSEDEFDGVEKKKRRGDRADEKLPPLLAKVYCRE